MAYQGQTEYTNQQNESTNVCLYRNYTHIKGAWCFLDLGHVYVQIRFRLGKVAEQRISW